MTPKIVITAILFVLIFITGFWVTRGGHPPQTLSLTVHKLLAVGAVVYLVMLLLRFSRISPFGTGLFVFCLGVGFLLLVTIATGGIISTPKTPPEIIQRIHHLLPYLVIAGTTLLFYLLLSRPD